MYFYLYWLHNHFYSTFNPHSLPICSLQIHSTPHLLVLHPVTPHPLHTHSLTSHPLIYSLILLHSTPLHNHSLHIHSLHIQSTQFNSFQIFVRLVACIVMTCIINPWLLLPLTPLTLLVFFIRHYAIHTTRDTKRLEAAGRTCFFHDLSNVDVTLCEFVSWLSTVDVTVGSKNYN